MKVEIMALRKVGDLARAQDLLSTEGAYEIHTARGGNPLAGKCQAPTLVIDRLESIVAPDLDVIRLAVNAIESQGYERVVFIAGLDRHGNFSKPVQQRIEAIERDVRVRKIRGRSAVHHDTLECPPSLFVETGFRRAQQPVFVLAMLESSRRISVPPELHDQLEDHGDGCGPLPGTSRRVVTLGNNRPLPLSRWPGKGVSDQGVAVPPFMQPFSFKLLGSVVHPSDALFALAGLAWLVALLLGGVTLRRGRSLLFFGLFLLAALLTTALAPHRSPSRVVIEVYLVGLGRKA